MSVTEQTYNNVMELYGYRCAECCGSSNIEIHHKLPQSKSRAKLYPLFLDSVLNLVPLCGGLAENCHLNHKHEYKITEREAAVFEDYLQSLKEK